MSMWTKILVPVLMLGLVGVAEAKGNKGGQKKDKPLVGAVVSVADDGNSVVVKAGKKATATETTVQTSISTAVEIDGVKGKAVKDLSVGDKVKVTPSTGLAVEIKATHAKGKHEKKGKGV